MIFRELEEIEDLEFRLGRAQRRDMDLLSSRIREELTTVRYRFWVKLIKRKELNTDSTYAQRNRREEFDELIEEQEEALDELLGDWRKDGVEFSVNDLQN